MPGIAKLLKGTELDQSTMGEANVRLILESRGLKKKQARTVAAGWAGDRYQIFTAADGKTDCLVWLTTWEDEAGATAFEAAMKEGLDKAGEKFSLERRATEVLLVQSTDASPAREGRAEGVARRVRHRPPEALPEHVREAARQGLHRRGPDLRALGGGPGQGRRGRARRGREGRRARLHVPPPRGLEDG